MPSACRLPTGTLLLMTLMMSNSSGIGRQLTCCSLSKDLFASVWRGEVGGEGRVGGKRRKVSALENILCACGWMDGDSLYKELKRPRRMAFSFPLSENILLYLTLQVSNYIFSLSCTFILYFCEVFYYEHSLIYHEQHRQQS